ncbi:ImuA family protein [Chelatococcus reniformis]|uniref:Protein ImuA n=1 Tax=Chelatococcus reniformis TaxID=1494448 RepID=A0A916UQN2_9HYPH|nr:DNA repair protein [Chelatococcus reniformis]GGC83563.1 hypothetical protein GCM10010994_46800 [Chelatococcus reniformis]
MQASALAQLRHTISRLEGRPATGWDWTNGSASGPGAGGTDPLATIRIGLGLEEADQVLQGGLRTAAVHEIFAAAADGPAATGFAVGLAQRVLSALAPAGRPRLLWIRDDFCELEWGGLFASGLVEWGLDPGVLVMVRVPRPLDGLRAAADALGCGGLAAVVLESSGPAALLDLTATRKLALAAAASGVTALTLRLDGAPVPSAAETRWLIEAAPSSTGATRRRWPWLGNPAFTATLARHRGGRDGRWTMEWDGDGRRFRAPPSEAIDDGTRMSLPLPLRPADPGPLAAETDGRTAGPAPGRSATAGPLLSRRRFPGRGGGQDR